MSFGFDCCCGCGCNGIINYITLKIEGIQNSTNCSGCDELNGTYKIKVQENVAGLCYFGELLASISHCIGFPDLALNIIFFIQDDVNSFTVSVNSINLTVQKPFNCKDLKGLIFNYPNTDARCKTILGVSKITILDIE